MQVLETVTTSLRLNFFSWYTDENATTSNVETLKQKNIDNSANYNVYLASSISGHNTFKDMTRFDYNVLFYPANDHINLSCQAMKIFVGMCDLNKINVDKKVLFNYIMCICDHYRAANSYHNFHHAFMVLQFTAAMVSNCDIHIPDIELFSILVSALIHDVDHPGTNNDFNVKTNSKYSQMYKESVLENHHITIGTSVIDGDCNILSKWSSCDVALFRQISRTTILSTDMKFHGDMVKDLAFRSSSTCPFDLSKDEDRLSLYRHLIHSADISNSVRPNKINSVISTYIADEFNKQTVQEKDLGVAVTTWMTLLDDISKAKTELLFLINVGQPYWKQLASCFPNKCLNNLLDNLDKNIQQYQHIINVE